MIKEQAGGKCEYSIAMLCTRCKRASPTVIKGKKYFCVECYEWLFSRKPDHIGDPFDKKVRISYSPCGWKGEYCLYGKDHKEPLGRYCAVHIVNVCDNLSRNYQKWQK